MASRRVALFYSRDLFGESLEMLLSKLEDVEVLGPWLIEKGASAHLEGCALDIAMVVDERPNDEGATALTTEILDQYSGLPVIHVMLEANVVRVINSHTFPASSKDLIEAIRNPQG
jgi:hypothetical protein